MSKSAKTRNKANSAAMKQQNSLALFFQRAADLAVAVPLGLAALLARMISRTLRSTVWLSLTAMFVLVNMVVMVLAYEAHIVNVTANIIQIEPPVLTAPGDIGWYNTTGGSNLGGIVDVVMTDADIDATHIFYTYGPGLDPLSIPTPVCGQIGPNGGGDLKTELIQLSLTSDTVVKAIACDGSDGSAHWSLINTKIYDFIDYACAPQIVSFPTNLAVLAAGPGDSSIGDIFIAANVDINGDTRSNDDINADGGGANRFLNGDATAGDTIEVANFTISGTPTQGAATTTLPDINIPFWEDKANDGGTVMGSLIFPNSTGGIELGPTEVLGNVTFEGSNTVTIMGPMHIHGNLVIEQNTTITQDVGFGSQFAAIIVDGTIDIDNNVEFVGNGSGAGAGAFLLVSNAIAQSLPTPDNAAIEVSNDSNPLGDVVLYATNGDVHINQNRVVLAIFAKEGTSNLEPAIDLDQNVTVDFRELPSTISCGPEFTPIEQLLINEFLPNTIDISGNTGLISPSSEAADTGGDGNGFETTPSNAFADTGGNASNANGAGDRHRYYGYSFGLPVGMNVDGIEVRTDWYLDSNSGTNSLSVELSWDGGTSWTTTQTSTDESTNSSNTDTVGGSTNTWGRSWLPTDFSSSNFRVRLTSNSTDDNRDFFLDWLPVTLYYSNGGDAGIAGAPLDGEFEELYNGSSSPVDVNGYVLYDDFVPAGVLASKTWTSTADFTPGVTSNTTVASNSVQLTAGQTSGTFEMVLDTGEGNRGDWTNLTWGETLSNSGDICVDVATSNDGISYSAFSAQVCGSPFSLAAIPDSRFIKWRSTHTRSNIAHTATLIDLAISYNLFDYHELVITSARTDPASTVIPSGGLLAVYRDGDVDFELDNDGIDTVKLYTNHVWLGGALVDSRTYNYGGAVPDDKSFTRIPDGTANWVDPDPTPGEPNEEFIDTDTTPTEPIVFESEPPAEGEELELPPPPEEQVLGETTETGDGTQPEAGPPGAETPPADETTEPVVEPEPQPTADQPQVETEPPVEETIPPAEETPPADEPQPTTEPQPEAGPPGAETPPADEPPAEPPADNPPAEPAP